MRLLIYSLISTVYHVDTDRVSVIRVDSHLTLVLVLEPVCSKTNRDIDEEEVAKDWVIHRESTKFQ